VAAADVVWFDDKMYNEIYKKNPKDSEKKILEVAELVRRSYY
jgi:hypothetical protein